MAAPTSPHVVGTFPALNITADISSLILGDSISFKQGSENEAYKAAASKSVIGMQFDDFHVLCEFKGFLTATTGTRITDLPGATVAHTALPFFPNDGAGTYETVLGIDITVGLIVCMGSTMNGTREGRMVGYDQAYQVRPYMPD